MKRRELLAMAATLPALGLGSRLYALGDSPARFLLVFLRGGYDCANFLIPYGSADYYAGRPSIAIARPDDNNPTGALALDADWALAPAVRDTLGPLYTQRQAAFIPFAGTDDLSRSHFETQDSIELGQPISGPRNLRSGYLGRLADVLTGAKPISFTDALPLVFQGGTDIPNVSLKYVSKPVFDDRQAELLTSLYAGHHLQPAVAEGLEMRQEVSRAMQDEMVKSGRGAINAKGFDVEAERVGTLMRDQYRLGFIDVGGWDTHVNEGGARGALANNLGNLSRGLQTFAQTLGPAWRNTVVMVISEFGRTFRENGNRGTDHGHGSVYWVLGGGISGGQILGRQQRVAFGSLLQNRDYYVLNDHRAIVGGLFKSMWGLSVDSMERVFPGVTPTDLQLV